MPPKKQIESNYPDKEAAKRRDEIVRRMIATPPKPFTPKPKAKAKKQPAKKKPR